MPAWLLYGARRIGRMSAAATRRQPKEASQAQGKHKPNTSQTQTLTKEPRRGKKLCFVCALATHLLLSTAIEAARALAHGRGNNSFVGGAAKLAPACRVASWRWLLSSSSSSLSLSLSSNLDLSLRFGPAPNSSGQLQEQKCAPLVATACSMALGSGRRRPPQAFNMAPVKRPSQEGF